MSFNHKLPNHSMQGPDSNKQQRYNKDFFGSLFDVSAVRPVTNSGFLLQLKHKHAGCYETVGVNMSVCISLALDSSPTAKTEKHFFHTFISHIGELSA